jgi:hypothetical protein
MRVCLQVLPSWDAPRTGSISFKIRTNEPNGLLMYSAGTTSAHGSTQLPLSLSTLVSLASRYTHALFGMQIRARPEIHLGLDAREVLWFQHTFPEFATFKTLPGGAALYMYWQGRRRAFLKLSLTGGARSVFRQQISSGKKCMLTLVVIIGNGPALLLGKDCLWISSRLYRDHSAMAEMLRIRVSGLKIWCSTGV